MFYAEKIKHEMHTAGPWKFIDQLGIQWCREYLV